MKFERGSTALIYAARGPHFEVIDILVQAGSDIHIKNKDGKTVLDIALDEKNHDIARMIAKRMCPKSKIIDSIYPLKYFM